MIGRNGFKSLSISACVIAWLWRFQSAEVMAIFISPSSDYCASPAGFGGGPERTSMKSTLAVLALLPLLAACSTTTAERLANNEVSCQAYGFKPGTDGYANCMMQRDFADRAEDQAQADRVTAALRSMNEDRALKPTIRCETVAAGRATNYGRVYQNSTTTCR